MRLIGILLMAVGASHAFASEARLAVEQAKEAAMASLRLSRGSSIDPDFDIRDVRNVDLDGDGVNEVVYRYSAICPNVPQKSATLDTQPKNFSTL